MGDGGSREWSRICQPTIVAPVRAYATMGFVKRVLWDEIDADIKGPGMGQ